MAKQLEDFKKQFAEIEKAVAAGIEEIKKDERLIGQTTGIVEQGTKEVGLRVQELKSKGMTGTTIDDFKNDPEVKKMLASIESYMQSIEKELNRINGLYNGSFKATKTKLNTLRDDLTKEIADRKKAVTTKLGTGNKSLPDMEKLLVEVKKFANGNYTTFDVFVPEQIAQHRSSLNRWLKDELAKTKEHALSDLQKMMDEQALNTRNLQKNFMRVKGAAEQIAALVKEIKQAASQSKNSEIPALQQKIPPLQKEFDEIIARYERGMQDQWTKARVQESKDKSTILNAVQQMTKWKGEIGNLVASVANVK